MRPVTFEVIGLPAPQGSKSAVVIGGKARLIEGRRSSGRERHKSWRDSVTAAARDVAGHDDISAPLNGALAIDVVFRMPRPQSRPKKHHGWHTVAPDKDKLLRSVFDGLQAGGLVANDSMFADVHCSAFEVVGWTGAVITIEQLGSAEFYDQPFERGCGRCEELPQ